MNKSHPQLRFGDARHHNRKEYKTQNSWDVSYGIVLNDSVQHSPEDSGSTIKQLFILEAKPDDMHCKVYLRIKVLDKHCNIVYEVLIFLFLFPLGGNLA